MGSMDPLFTEKSLWLRICKGASTLLSAGLTSLYRFLDPPLVMGMASRSPWVVPSWERIASPSTNSSVGALYVLIKMVARGGQSVWILWRAAYLFRELNALLASTTSTASFSSDSRAVRTACTAASMPEICLPHSWTHLEISCTSGLTMLSIALAIIRLAVSPMPIGRTSGYLFRAVMR